MRRNSPLCPLSPHHKKEAGFYQAPVGHQGPPKFSQCRQAGKYLTILQVRNGPEKVSHGLADLTALASPAQDTCQWEFSGDGGRAPLGSPQESGTHSPVKYNSTGKLPPVSSWSISSRLLGPNPPAVAAAHKGKTKTKATRKHPNFTHGKEDLQAGGPAPGCTGCNQDTTCVLRMFKPSIC